MNSCVELINPKSDGVKSVNGGAQEGQEDRLARREGLAFLRG